MRKRTFVFTPALALLACGMLCAAPSARADPRFGDSSWVAPDAPPEEPTASGSRADVPDHARGWETALRAPFRAAFFPLRLTSRGLEAIADRYGDRLHDRNASHARRPGISIGPAFDLGGVSDIAVGPAITWVGVPVADSKLTLAGTWSTIDRRRVQLSHVIHDRRTVAFRLGATYDYKPNRRFFGTGNGTPKTDLSYFLLESTTAKAALLLGASPFQQLRVVSGFSSMSPRRGYHSSPLLENVFPTGVPYEHRATQEWLYGVTGDLASLDDPRDPSFGIHGRLELMHAAGLRDRDPDYNQWLFEGRAYVPVFAKRRVIALRGVYSGIDPTGGATTLPYYRLISSGGALHFAGYPNDRFRDRQLALFRGEYRWSIVHRVSALALYELGMVAPRTSALALSTAHRSYGGGLRLGMSEGSAARLEVGKSVEGMEVNLQLGCDF
jgi:surface antigen Omp85-like protein